MRATIRPVETERGGDSVRTLADVEKHSKIDIVIKCETYRKVQEPQRK